MNVPDAVDKASADLKTILDSMTDGAPGSPEYDRFFWVEHAINTLRAVQISFRKQKERDDHKRRRTQQKKINERKGSET